MQDETIEAYILKICAKPCLKSNKSQSDITITGKHYRALLKDSWALSRLMDYDAVLDALDQMEIDFFDEDEDNG